MVITPYTNNSTDLFGKTVNNLQSNIAIVNDSISGTLKYIADYSAAYGEEMKAGNFLVLHAEPQTGVTITIQLIGGTTPEATLDSDGITITRVTDKDNQIIRFKATKNGDTLIKDFTLTGLTLESA